MQLEHVLQFINKAATVESLQVYFLTLQIAPEKESERKRKEFVGRN